MSIGKVNEISIAGEKLEVRQKQRGLGERDCRVERKRCENEKCIPS